MNRVVSRWLALGLLMAIVLLVILVLLLPLLMKTVELKETTGDLAFKLKRYERILARKDAVFDSVEKLTAQYQEQGYFYTQSTEALASAALQGTIKTTIANAGGQLTSTQILPSKNTEGFVRVAIKVRMSGDMNVLRSVLYQLESAKPLLMIEQLDIRPVRGSRNRQTRKIEPSSELNVNFQVLGFMKASAQ